MIRCGKVHRASNLSFFTARETSLLDRTKVSYSAYSWLCLNAASMVVLDMLHPFKLSCKSCVTSPVSLHSVLRLGTNMPMVGLPSIILTLHLRAIHTVPDTAAGASLRIVVCAGRL